MFNFRLFLFLLGFISLTLADCPHERPGIRRWSDSSSWESGTPISGESIEITESLLMDISPPDLGTITLTGGGSLTFDPDVDLTLRAANIHVQDGGTLEIGSEDCPYSGDLTITLTGTRESHQGETEPKAILVAEGGTLEIHGENRLPWTKITSTLTPPTTSDDDTFFVHEQHANSELRKWSQCIVAYTFKLDENGIPSVKQFGNYLLKWHHQKLARHIESVEDGEILMMASQIQIELGSDTAAYDAFETLIYGEVTGDSILRAVKQDGSTWAFVYQKGNIDSYSEKTNPMGVSSRASFCISIDLCFMSEARKGDPESGISGQQDNFIVGHFDVIYPKIGTTDDVSSWREGPVKFVHFGEILHNAVDMRAEVLLLNRRVKINGEMEEECPAFNENCDDKVIANRDTFGAHIKILKGYANVHIENVELFNVGQQTDLGRYPIHFHLALDKVPEASVPYVKGNSIHDTFARCITIHGSHGIQVIDNTCYNHMGHGYFMEDGAEMENLLDGNLAMSTRKGTGKLEPVDLTRPSAFWLTNPNNRFRNNVAAGGDGTGIWVLYPDEPLPPSRSFNLMNKFEARNTMIKQFDNHVAHSNNFFGIMIGDVEQEDRSTECCNLWQPRDDPRDPKSTPLDIPLSRMTGYKNRFTNIWIEGGKLNVSKISVSDSVNGLFVTNEGQQDRFAGRLSRAVIIGESPNVGVPTEGFDRSLPLPWTEKFRQWPQSGLTLWKGPTQFSDIWFDGFQTNQVYDIAAIAKKRGSPYPFSVTTPFINAQFAFADEEGGGRLTMSGDKGVNPGWERNRDGELNAGFTLYVDAEEKQDKLYVVKPDHLSAAAADCAIRPNWRLAICSTKYGNLRLKGEFKDLGTHGIFVRDDLPSAQLDFELEKKVGPQVVLDGSRTYTFHTTGPVPETIRFTADGIETGDTLRIGICLPEGSTFDLTSFFPHSLRNLGQFTSVDSLADLDEHDPQLDGKKYFHDKTTGMLYYKFIGSTVRAPGEAATCGGGRCPYILLKLEGSTQKADCREKIYAGKLNMEKVPLPLFTDMLPATGAKHPPSGYGAGPTRPFDNRGGQTEDNRETKVNGKYGPWSKWSECSVTCGEGIETRFRTCDSPAPANGGTDCSGDDIGTRLCFRNPCGSAVDGRFSKWTSWSTCETYEEGSCSGFTSRQRDCSNPAPSNGGKSCFGPTQMIKPCDPC